MYVEYGQNPKPADARRACVIGLRQVNSSPALTKFPEKKKFISEWGRKCSSKAWSLLIRQSEEGIIFMTGAPD